MNISLVLHGRPVRGWARAAVLWYVTQGEVSSPLPKSSFQPPHLRLLYFSILLFPLLPPSSPPSAATDGAASLELTHSRCYGVDLSPPSHTKMTRELLWLGTKVVSFIPNRCFISGALGQREIRIESEIHILHLMNKRLKAHVSLVGD